LAAEDREEEERIFVASRRLGENYLMGERWVWTGPSPITVRVPEYETRASELMINGCKRDSLSKTIIKDIRR
jgi:hypothetical protein